jgi:hypothetical protein
LIDKENRIASLCSTLTSYQKWPELKTIPKKVIMSEVTAFESGFLPVFQKTDRHIGHIVLKRIFGRNSKKIFLSRLGITY